MYEFEPILRRLKDAKSASGLTNKELSEKSSVPLGTVNKILSGDTEEPKLPAIMALAEALDVSADYLIYGERRDQPASAYYQSFSAKTDTTLARKQNFNNTCLKVVRLFTCLSKEK